MNSERKKIDIAIEESKTFSSERRNISIKKLIASEKISVKLGYRHDEVLYYLAIGLYHAGKLDKAIYSIEKCLEIQRSSGDDTKLAESLSFYGNILDNLGNYEAALDVLNRALHLQIKSGNKISRVYTYIRIGNIYRKYLKDTDRSIEYYKKALQLSEQLKDKALIASSLGSIGNAYLYKQNHRMSREYYIKAAKMFEETGIDNYLCSALLGLGTANRLLNKNDESILCLLKGLSVAQKTKSLSMETSISLNLAISYLHADDKKNGHYYYEKSMSLIKKVDDKTLAAKLYQGFAEVFEQKKDFENAYNHFVKYHKLYSETFKEESERVNRILRLKYEKEKSERESEIYKLKARELQIEIDSKTKELNSMASYLSQKNEFVKNLVDNVKKDFNELKIEDTGSFISNAVKKAESASHVNEDLKRFETELNKFSFDFIEKLSRRFSGLTRVELKICSMIKINLSTKEIANLLYLSTRTVESHKYNIYKKIKLKSNQNIVTFLNSI